MDITATLARDFERESHRIDQLIWDAMTLQAGETVLFCGLANNLEWIRRAAAIGVTVTVVSDDSSALREMRDLPVTPLRGSTSMLPAKDDSFDVAVAFHYLHEVDPLFHANIVSELSRVAKRCIIVEPAPPSDPLGARIASLYSRAKRELGQFEYYHNSDYWRKLVSIVKPNVSCQTFTFMRTPPPHAVRGTVSLIIDTMAAEQTPESYLAELRALAARPDAGLLPQARYVIVGSSPGVVANATAGTDFREPAVAQAKVASAVKPFIPPPVTPPPAPTAPAAPTLGSGRVYSSPDIEPEFPALPAPGAASPATGRGPGLGAESDPISPIARNAFGLPLVVSPSSSASAAPPAAGEIEADEAAFGVPRSGAETPAEFGWAWEPPE